MAVRCQSLQPLQQRPTGHESSSDHERPGPSKAEHPRDHEIADEVVDLPTEPSAGLPIGGAQGDHHEHDYDGHAENFAISLIVIPSEPWISQRLRASVISDR